MRTLPAGLDAGTIAALAQQLRSHAEQCAGVAADLSVVRRRVAQSWIGDAADRYKIHVEWKEKALVDMADATTQAAGAAFVYAEAIRIAAAAHEEAVAGVRLAESHGNIPAAWNWGQRRDDIVEQLENAAQAFADSLNDRFTAGTSWWSRSSWDYDDLDALAARRDRDLDGYDRLLEIRSDMLRRTGLVDGVPDRIPPPPPDPDSIPNGTDQFGNAAGITLGPSSEFKVGLRGGATATVKRYDNGVVEVEYDVRGGGTITIGDYEGEQSKAAVYRYVFPDAATAQSFFDRLELMQRQRPNEIDAAQFDEQFSRYRTGVGTLTTVKGGSDRPFVDQESAVSYGTETNPQTEDRTTVTKIEAKSRANAYGVGGGAEIDVEVRETTTRSNEPKQLEVTFSGHNKTGVVIETDILKQVGADQNPRVQRGLDLVKGQYEQFDGQYGRVKVKVDLSTPEGRELAEQLRSDAETRRLPSRETIERAQRLGKVEVEAGTFTERNGKFELEPTPRSPGVLLEGTNRSYDPQYRTAPK